MSEDALPKNLGGGLEVADWLAQRRDLDKASAQLSQLDMLMSVQEAAANGGAAGGGAKSKGPLVWAGREASEEELLIIGTIRVNVAELTAEEKSELGPWLMNLENEDILRFIRRDKTAERTWEALKVTSKWRKEERIDDIANEEIDIMPEGGEEFYFTGMDNDDRPVLVYRACAHTPGRVDPDKYNRYVIKTLEYGVKEYGVGKTRQVAVVVDRVGSGLKNQVMAMAMRAPRERRGGTRRPSVPRKRNLRAAAVFLLSPQLSPVVPPSLSAPYSERRGGGIDARGGAVVAGSGAAACAPAVLHNALPRRCGQHLHSTSQLGLLRHMVARVASPRRRQAVFLFRLLPEKISSSL
jgi:hypothetical protein